MIRVMNEVQDRTPQHAPGPKPSMESLIEGLASKQAEVRESSRKMLITHGISAIKPLTALLSSRDPQIRWEAAKSLGEIHHKDSAAALASCLGDEHRDVRWVAGEGLISMGRDALEPVLKELIGHADSVWVRGEAEHILRAQSEGRAALLPVLDALIGRAPLFEVPVAAFHALKGVRTPAATSPKRTRSR